MLTLMEMDLNDEGLNFGVQDESISGKIRKENTSRLFFGKKEIKVLKLEAL